ncbi:NUDIX domain-containing protein [Candidatus Daviesbacteria bacterium]|nr:NUDIX domain-containing protein [Candidatus Daviesbacteria bacterium]
MRIIKKIALAVFKDKKILQVRTKKQPVVFYTLGGKIEKGETDLECLQREVKEEIGCSIASVKFLHEFEDVAHGKQAMLRLKMYEGSLKGEPKPSSEIAEIGWFDSKSDPENLSIIAKRTIFPWLKMHGYID